jgi:hypothetical protein
MTTGAKFSNACIDEVSNGNDITLALSSIERVG